MSEPSASVLSKPGRIAVVGAGAVGLSCAFHLQRFSHQVEILDLRDPGEGASLGNAGIIATSEVFPVARAFTLRKVPRMLLDPIGPLVIRWRYAPFIAPWLVEFLIASRPAEVRRISLALSDLLGPAVEAWRDLARTCAAEHRLLSRGWLRLFPTRQHVEAAAREAATQRELGVRVEMLEAAEACELEPALASGFAGAAFFPEVSHLTSPLAMMRSIATYIVNCGARIEKREVQRIEVVDGKPVVVDISGKRSQYDRLIIAAGAWSRRLVRTLGLDVSLDTERGYHVMLPTPSRTLQRPVSVPNPGYSLVQMEDGLRVTTGVEFGGLEAPPDFRRIHRMIAHARSTLPGLASEPLSKWLGFRPSMPKSMPVIGPLERHPQVVLAFGHGHLGLTLGPITGKLIAEMLAGRKPSVDPAPFLPSHSVR